MIAYHLENYTISHLKNRVNNIILKCSLKNKQSNYNIYKLYKTETTLICVLRLPITSHQAEINKLLSNENVKAYLKKDLNDYSIKKNKATKHSQRYKKYIFTVTQHGKKNLIYELMIIT